MSSSKPADEFARALAVAIRRLRTGVRSTHEVRAYLTGRRVPPETTIRVLSECHRRGLLDDRACARLWADHWAGRGYAWAVIRQRLAMKGLSAAVLDAAAAGMDDAAADEERARQAASSWLRRQRPDTARHPARLSRLLASRGFHEELIEQIIADTFGSPIDADR